MRSLHSEFDRLSKGFISRREFFKRAAALGVATPLIIQYLSGCAAPPAPSAGPAAARGPVKAPAADVDTAKQLIFRGWAYAVDTVEDNTKRFNEAYKETVDYKTITGDYISIIENMHINNQPLDMVYANPATVARWAVPGWIHDFENFWDAQAAKDAMYDGVRESLTVNGKLMGLPYFVSIRGNIVANNVILEKVGIKPEDYPKTWTELYDLCRRIKKDGAADTPLLPHWFTSGAWFGVSWGYLFECLNRGAVLFNDANEPVFDEQTLAILHEWKQAYDDGLIPEGVFTMGETDYIDAFASGKYAFSPQQTYDLKVFNDPARSQIAGQCQLVPVNGQPWGLVDEGIYCLANRKQDDTHLARGYRLAGFFGYRNHEGNLFVAKRWAIENALNSGYKEILEDAEVIEAYKKWIPNENQVDVMKGIIGAGQFPKVWQTFWWEEFNASIIAELQQAILGQKDVKEIHDGFKKRAEELRTRYKS